MVFIFVNCFLFSCVGFEIIVISARKYTLLLLFVFCNLGEKSLAAEVDRRLFRNKVYRFLSLFAKIFYHLAGKFLKKYFPLSPIVMDNKVCKVLKLEMFNSLFCVSVCVFVFFYFLEDLHIETGK